VLAVLYDIHGNLPALEAVVADARGAGADGFVLGGDYAALGAWPAATVALLESLDPVAMIAGNHERWLAGEDGDIPAGNAVVPEAIDFERAALGADVVARITSLPATAEHAGALFCHASPTSDMRGFSPEDDPADDELLAGATQQRVVFGHTHLQFRRLTDAGTELVNPGSVGLPFDGDSRAAYALLDDDGRLRLRRVAYDTGAAAEALLAFGEPWADAVAGWLDRARYT
jgi:diadenosine tetraphosphatase ApaH/serine/threonine PP2A family protein phosphatase